MILADKIVKLRRKKGWSQEELAEKMEVSRQAVSKWESAQTIPDIQKILQLSHLFGVTTDYLLKDEIEDEGFTDTDGDTVRKVSLSQADAYLKHRHWAAKRIALATFLCILGVALLILFAGLAIPPFSMSEDVCAMIGIIALFLSVGVAVALYIHCGFQSAPYEFLEKEPFENECGVADMVTHAQDEMRPLYIRYNIIATVMCIFAALVVVIGGFLSSENSVVVINALPLALCIVASAVYMFIFAGVKWASTQRLLRQGEFAKENKRQNKLKEAISSIYWLLAVAIFLVISFTQNTWEHSWVIMAVAGVLYGAVMGVCSILEHFQK